MTQKVIRFFVYSKNKLPNTSFQSQSIPTFPIPLKAFINSTSTEKLSRNGSNRNTEIRFGWNEK